MTDRLRISTDPAQLDLDTIYDYLTESYWARGIGRDLVARSIKNSLCFGGYIDGAQIAFARVISDFATFAYLGDVFVLEEHQGAGYGMRLMQAVFDHPELQGLRRFMLATSSAHSLYRKFGFTDLANSDFLMERCPADIYAKS